MYVVKEIKKSTLSL